MLDEILHDCLSGATISFGGEIAKLVRFTFRRIAAIICTRSFDGLGWGRCIDFPAFTFTISVNIQTLNLVTSLLRC